MVCRVATSNVKRFPSRTHDTTRLSGVHAALSAPDLIDVGISRAIRSCCA
jgi:hypothetical protein